MIPLVDLKRQYQSLSKKLDNAVIKILSQSNFILGDEVSKFEESFAKYIGVKHCIGVSSGESAILLILKALGIKGGDEIITVPNTFIATVFPIVTLGARPVFVDIDPQTFQVNLKKLEQAITPKTKIILPVHLFGIPAPMGEILKIAKKYNLLVVEDACQAHGSSINGKKCGSFGIASAHSFYPGKNLGAAGDAGGITTNDDELAKKLNVMRNIGQVEKYKHDLFGYNFRMDTIQAAYLSVKLKYLDSWNKERRNLALLYNKLLSNLPLILPPQLNKKYLENFHLYIVRSEFRDELLNYLKENGIQSGVHYPIPVHLQKSLAFLGYKKGDFPFTEKYANEIISLPIFPKMTRSEVVKVTTVIKQFYIDADKINKVVVFGGAGFIGSWVVDYLLLIFRDRIKEIIVFDNFCRGNMDNLREALKSKKVKIVKGDIRDVKQVEEVITGADYVIHEAAIKNITCDEDPRLGKETLIDGTFNIMEACVKHKVKKLVFNSSASVYGQPLALPMKESDPYNNDAFYGAGKIADEQLAKAFRKNLGLNYVSFRPFNVYGPRMDVGGIYTDVFIKWLDRIEKDEAPVIFGDGKNTLDFIYVEDIASATIGALESPVNEGFYNLGSGKETSLNELARTLLSLTKPKLKVEYKEEMRKSNYVTRRRASMDKAKKDLGFIAKTSLKIGLRKLIEWRKEIKK